jgi:hypothetical protein
MNIWLFQTSLTRRLMAWSIFSMVASLPMFFAANPLWRGLGI